MMSTCSSYDAAEQRLYDEIKERTSGYPRLRKARADYAALQGRGGTIFIDGPLYTPPGQSLFHETPAQPEGWRGRVLARRA